MWIDSEWTQATMEFLLLQHEDPSVKYHGLMPHTNHINVLQKPPALPSAPILQRAPWRVLKKKT